MDISKQFSNIAQVEKNLRDKPESWWLRRGEQRALRLFQAMSKRVPAYRTFLRKNRINSSKIKTIADFKNIPPVDKDNYLRKYSLEKLCWDGKLSQKHFTYSATSGTSGVPFYFPRESTQDRQYATIAELYLRDNFQIDKKRTLYINCFALGVWIGGLFTYDAVNAVAQNRNYSLSIISPGLNMDEIIKAVKNLGHLYEQVLLGGYPPFIKDVIDLGTDQGIIWKDYNIGIIFSAEGFSEKFRNYIIKQAGIKNELKGTLNHYGTVDLGTMSYETPSSIFLRRELLKNLKQYKTFFHRTDSLPTVTQYIPELFYFEEIQEKLICSSYSGLPLVRYALKDDGGLFSSLRAKEFIAGKIPKGINSWNLPYVYVYSRSDNSVTLYGLNIYIDTIRNALLDHSIQEVLTSRFTMSTKYRKNQDQYLEIVIEIKENKKVSQYIKKKVETLVIDSLINENSEYAKLFKTLPARAKPVIVFSKKNTENSSQNKHKWVT